MPRIQTYPNDTQIGLSDRVIGSDGDSNDATKNYKVLDLLDYLGNAYNLQSVDLIYAYNAVVSTSVGSGEISSNNYADNPNILASEITNLYASKTTAFGQDVELFLETAASNGFDVMFVDLDDYNNFAQCSMTSVSDVDANTLNIGVTVVFSNGSFSTGTNVGLKIFPASSVDLSNYVTLNTSQTITGSKNFTGFFTTFTDTFVTFERLDLNGHVPPNTSGGVNKGYFGFSDDDFYYFQRVNSGQTGKLNFNNITQDRTYAFQDKSGTIAHLDDIDVTQTDVGEDGVSITTITDTWFSSSPTTVNVDARRIADTVTLNGSLAAATIVPALSTEYTYRATFDLTGFSPTSTSALSLSVSMSNQIIRVKYASCTAAINSTNTRITIIFVVEATVAAASISSIAFSGAFTVQ